MGHLPYKADEKDIEREFDRFGKISNIAIKKGFAFIVPVSNSDP